MVSRRNPVLGLRLNHATSGRGCQSASCLGDRFCARTRPNESPMRLLEGERHRGASAPQPSPGPPWGGGMYRRLAVGARLPWGTRPCSANDRDKSIVWTKAATTRMAKTPRALSRTTLRPNHRSHLYWHMKRLNLCLDLSVYASGERIRSFERYEQCVWHGGV